MSHAARQPIVGHHVVCGDQAPSAANGGIAGRDPALATGRGLLAGMTGSGSVETLLRPVGITAGHAFAHVHLDAVLREGIAQPILGEVGYPL